MAILFNDVANRVLTLERVLKYRKWIQDSEKARESGSLNEKRNQYDKR